MRRVLFAMAMLACAAGAQARPAGLADCGPFKLLAQDLARIRTAARTVVQTPLNPRSTGNCRQRQEDWFTAEFDTVRIPQGDGSERWKSLTCRSDFHRQAPWKCQVWADTRAIHLAPTANSRSIEVSIPDDLDVGLARQYVAQAFELLAQPGSIPYCGYAEGAKIPPALPMPRADWRPLPDLRRDLGADQGDLVLMIAPEGFAISHQLLYVYYLFDQPTQRSARLQCWQEEEITVTS